MKPSPEDEAEEFIKQELLPEMVHNRCFCESASREFVEFESARAKPYCDHKDLAKSCEETTSSRKSLGTLEKSRKDLEELAESCEKSDTTKDVSQTCKVYRARAVVRFSGEPKIFSLFVKLLPGYEDEEAFLAFQNEEMFYNKMTAVYRLNSFATCYAADLGKYGRPVLALQDLQTDGYVVLERPLDADHWKLCLRTIGEFHGKGLMLKNENFNVFREFQAKLNPRKSDPINGNWEPEEVARILESLKSHEKSALCSKLAKALSDEPLSLSRILSGEEADEFATICHGKLSARNFLIRHENEKAVEAKLVGWQSMKFGSPALDLGQFLFLTMSDESALTTVQEALPTYFEAVKRLHPRLTCAAQFKEDLLGNLPSTYLILSRRDDSLANVLVERLLLLERLLELN